MTEREKLLNDTLYHLGITRNNKMYRVLFSAVLKVVDDPDLLFLVTKNLHVQLAKETHSTLAAIERIIRLSAKKAWETNPEYLQKITHLDLTGRPTGTELVDLLAIYIERTLDEKASMTA